VKKLRVCSATSRKNLPTFASYARHTSTCRCFHAPEADATLLPDMAREIVSTARPSTLRLAGFLALTTGGLMISLGSLMTWATVPPFDTPTRGTDLWEGMVTLTIGVAVLVAMVAMRLMATATARRAVAVAILALGLSAAAIAAADAVRATSRFTSPDQRDRIARELAGDLHLPYEQVRSRLEALYEERFHVSVQPGLFVVMAGGLVAAIGGALSVAWAARASTPRVEPEVRGPGDGVRS